MDMQHIRKILDETIQEIDFPYPERTLNDRVYSNIKRLFEMMTHRLGRDTYEDETLLSELKRYLQLELCGRFDDFHTEGHTALIGCSGVTTPGLKIVITITQSSVIVQGTRSGEPPFMTETPRIQGKTIADAISAINEVVQYFEEL